MMKKTVMEKTKIGLIAMLAVAFLSTSAFAGSPHGSGYKAHGYGGGYKAHRYGGGHWTRGHSGSGWMWVVPAIVGGVIVYEATRQPPPQTIIIQQSVEPNCSPWTEIQNPDGTITRTRTCNK